MSDITQRLDAPKIAAAFKLSPHLAKQYREFTDSIWAAAPSEKLEAFTTSARYVFGMSSPEFPLPEKADRLLMAAQVNGLVDEYGDDVIQARLTAACANPIAIDEDWPRLDAAAKISDGFAPVHESAPLIKSSKQFVADFVPPDYLVDGLLQEGFLYSLTGATGAGKTAITLRLAASVALGAIFANRETKKRRVLYLAAENPADVRMRWIALAQQMDFDADKIEVYFVEGAFKISQMADQLKKEAEIAGGEFGLVIIDTGPVFYEGDDENNRTQQGRHAEMLRDLIDIIPGKPAVLANVHPVKNALPDNLLPAGGGSFLNQVDGNLTASKTDNTTELHWQGKYRGVEFAPMHFMLKTVTHERLKDSKGRLMPTVISEWISDRAKEEIAAKKITDENEVLAFIAANPKATQEAIAIQMGWKLYNGEPNRMRAGRCIKTLLKAKLIQETRAGNYTLTKDGKAALEDAK
jgi:AAA domain